jgi:excisionase family DNA binding protein
LAISSSFGPAPEDVQASTGATFCRARYPAMENNYTSEGMVCNGWIGKFILAWYSYVMLTTTQAADKLGITRRRVVALIQAGQLPAAKFGSQYIIKPKDLKLVAVRKPGRPKKGR